MITPTNSMIIRTTKSHTFRRKAGNQLSGLVTSLKIMARNKKRFKSKSLEFRASLCIALLCALAVCVDASSSSSEGGFSLCSAGTQPTLPKDVTGEFKLIKWPKNEIEKCRCGKRHRYCIEGKFGQAVMVEKNTSMWGHKLIWLGIKLGICEYVPNGEYVIKLAKEIGNIKRNKDVLENDCAMSRLIQAKPHRNLVRVMRVGKHDDYILLERCEPLGELDDDDILDVLRSAMHALSHMHTVIEIAHLDLHRSQLAKTWDATEGEWVYKLLDFGASKDAESDEVQADISGDYGITNLIEELKEVTQDMSKRTRRKLKKLKKLCETEESVDDILAEW